MALSKTGLKQRILTELTAKGFTVSGEHSRNADYAEAIANAIVDEIQANAKAIVSSGSSAGSWPVK
ncbi:hypothetical protein [Vibrio algicola]|uniref:Uncharacterized protein n=1 Tax=Vibrio algicola TaxID=2662262 RepID=A0A5Q0TIC9_9VIBR|nr:hypothetical protein [Vibrio algicola]